MVSDSGGSGLADHQVRNFSPPVSTKVDPSSLKKLAESRAKWVESMVAADIVDAAAAAPPVIKVSNPARIHLRVLFFMVF